jgi:FkbM family methyltransferase
VARDDEGLVWLHVRTQILGLVRVAQLTPTPPYFFDIDTAVTARVFIDVGTNLDPDFLPLANKSKELFYIALEPQPKIFIQMVEKVKDAFQAEEKEYKQRRRWVAIPAAVGPQAKNTTFYVSDAPMCSSMLPQKSRHGNTNKCFKVADQITVPVIPIDDILHYVPPSMPVYHFAIDAQGFDYAVALSGAKNMKRVQHVVLECQDLVEGDPYFLQRGAYPCSLSIHCLPKRFPQLSFVGCYPNVAHEEYNCLFRNEKMMSEDERAQNGYGQFMSLMPMCGRHKRCRWKRGMQKLLPGTSCEI